MSAQDILSLQREFYALERGRAELVDKVDEARKAFHDADDALKAADNRSSYLESEIERLKRLPAEEDGSPPSSDPSGSGGAPVPRRPTPTAPSGAAEASPPDQPRHLTTHRPGVIGVYHPRQPEQ